MTHTVTGTWTRTAGTLNGGSSTLSLGGSVSGTGGTFTASTGTVNYNGSAQAIAVVTYNNLTINQSSGSATLSDNATVNGTLTLTSGNLAVANLKGLTMGASATTTGAKDVTGIVTRTTLVPATSYTFGNQFTTITFDNAGTLPTAISVNITIGSAPSWKTGAILRYYDIMRTGGSGGHATLNLHYLDAELNGNTENALVKWGIESPFTPGTELEYGHSNHDHTDNWVGTSSVDAAIWHTSFGLRSLTLANSNLTSSNWTGATSSEWINPANWTPNGVPSDTSDAVIPDAATTPNDPTLSATTTAGRLTINSGGILNAPASSNFTLSGGSGAWMNSGTFNASTGTVTFTSVNATVAGTTDFYNVTVNSSAELTLGSYTVMRIGGTITNNGMWHVNLLPTTTVEYNGGSQTVLNPNGETAGYRSLILSGSGTKTMPGTALTINDNFSMSGTPSATAGAAINTTGNFTVGSGTSFTTGANSHAIGGDFSNSGTFTATSGGTVTFNGTAAQTISGATTFYNLTINNSSGVSISNNETISNTLTFTSGNIATSGSNVIIASGGTVSRTSGHVVGNLQKAIDSNGSVSRTFEFGTGSDYTPIAVVIAGVAGSGGGQTLAGSSTGSEHASISTSGIDSAKNVNRYWTLTYGGTWTFTSYNATFTFVSGDKDAGVNTSVFAVRKYTSGTWSAPPGGVTTAALSTTGVGFTAFGDYVVGHLPWESYLDAGYTTVNDSFTGSNTNVYMLGTSFANGTYLVAYYDGSGDKRGSETADVTTGNLTSIYVTNSDPSAATGTWHALVQPNSGYTVFGTNSYATITASPNTYGLAANDSFTVEADAIPEFPTVLAAIGVVGLCVGIYWWLRRRSLAYVKA
ncbi:MAG: hypothetical protein HW402_655 [Dehalococcoidales bacterium]|nr:hypothetical protein [Dehalococcoidales bacterium]